MLRAAGFPCADPKIMTCITSYHPASEALNLSQLRGLCVSPGFWCHVRDQGVLAFLLPTFVGL